jgi:peptidyl-dipeptidase Dcp
VSAAKSAAAGRGKSSDTLNSGLVAPLSRSFVEPMLTSATNQEVRKKVFEVWSKRGEIVSARDNKPLALEILKLRAEQAEMHGYKCFGDYNVDDTMARTTSAVSDLLLKVWTPAKVAAVRERGDLEALLQQEKGSAAASSTAGIEPWDWRYYAEKVRQQKYDFDEEKVKPFLKLEFMVEAVFDVAFKIFGLQFQEIEAPSYHADVKIFEVCVCVVFHFVNMILDFCFFYICITYAYHSHCIQMLYLSSPSSFSPPLSI